MWIRVPRFGGVTPPWALRRIFEIGSSLVNLNIKIVDRIAVTDVFDHIADQFNITRQFAIFNIISQQVAQNPPKIFVPRIGKKTS